MTWRDALILYDYIEHVVDEAIHGLDLRPLDTRLSMDTKTQLDLVLGEGEAGGACRWYGASPERDTHASERCSGLACSFRHLVQLNACLGRCARYLVDQNGARDSSAP
jgi:hypothetical protein